MTGGGYAVAEQNRFSGLISHVVRDTVMAQVEIQAGRTGWRHCSVARPRTSSAWSQEAGGNRRLGASVSVEIQDQLISAREDST
jgi:hypothetical protein